MKIAFECVGEMPLLLHWDNIEGGDLLAEWRKDPANKNVSVPGDDRSPAWTWQTYVYTDGTSIVMPAENVMVCLRQAAAQIIMKKQKTFKEVSQSGIIPTSEYFDFYCAGKQIPIAELHAMRDDSFKVQFEKVQKLGFKLFMKRARVGQSKHVRVRPRFEQWSVKGVMNVVKPELTWEIIQKIFELAGSVGLCDWRPGCKTPGPYGMFTAKVKKV